MNHLSSFLTIACSGPRAYLAIATNIGISKHQALFVAGIVFCSLVLSLKRREIPKVALIIILPLCFHPAWTVSATHGDCGAQKLGLSLALSFFSLALLAHQIITYVRAEGLKIRVDPVDGGQ